jgi:hypothetical protein
MGAAVSQARCSSGSGGGSGSGSGRRLGAPTGAGEDVTDSPQNLVENMDGIKRSHPSQDRVLEIDGRNIVDSGSEHSRKEIARDSDQDKYHDVETPLSGSGAKQEDSKITKNDSDSNNWSGDHKTVAKSIEEDLFAQKLSQEMADAELAEKIAYEMMDEECALKLAAEMEGIHSSNPVLQSAVDRKLQEENDAEYAKKMAELYELESSDTDCFRNEIHRIRDMSLQAEINSKQKTERKVLELARATYQEQQLQEAEKIISKKTSRKKEYNKSDSLASHLSPNHTLSEKQKSFFQRFGFVVIRQVFDNTALAAASSAAVDLLVKDAKSDNVLDADVKEFSNLPEGYRHEWADVKDDRLRTLFADERNLCLCRSVIGDFEFDITSHNSKTYKGKNKNKTGNEAVRLMFAPRFRAWDLYPPQSKYSKKSLSHGLRRVCPSYPIDLNDLPQDFDPWTRQFLVSANDLGMTFAPCEFENWHVVGWDVMEIAAYSLLWGTFLSPLQRGNLGNLIVYPGSHHCISKLLLERGARNSVWYDSRKGEGPVATLPSLFAPGVSDGRGYEVLVKEGDVIIMHPFLAHGEGTNVSVDPRMAMFGRLRSNEHLHNRQKMHQKGDLLGPRTWSGDIFSLQPGLASAK